MYSGEFLCSLIINKCKKTIWNNSSIIRTQGNIDPVYFTFSPENYATFMPVISLCDLFWCDLSSLPKVKVVIRISDDVIGLHS